MVVTSSLSLPILRNSDVVAKNLTVAQGISQGHAENVGQSPWETEQQHFGQRGPCRAHRHYDSCTGLNGLFFEENRLKDQPSPIESLHIPHYRGTPGIGKMKEMLPFALSSLSAAFTASKLIKLFSSSCAFMHVCNAKRRYCTSEHMSTIPITLLNRTAASSAAPFHALGHIGVADQPLEMKGMSQWEKRLTESSTVKMAVKKMSSCGVRRSKCLRGLLDRLRVRIRVRQAIDSSLPRRARNFSLPNVVWPELLTGSFTPAVHWLS